MQPRHLLISVPPERAMWWSSRKGGRGARPAAVATSASGRGGAVGMGIVIGELVPLQRQRAGILPAVG
jgi:hypothetical protein